MSTRQSFDPQWQDAVESVVEEILDRCGVTEPPVHADEVARALGFELRECRDQQSRGSLVRTRRRMVIVLRPEPRLERRHWAIAHEIGECLMPMVLDRIGSDRGGPDVREELANRFASALLAPRAWLEEDCRRLGDDLLELKRTYATASFEVLAVRLLDADRPTIVTIFDNGRVTRRWSNLSFRPPPLHPLELRAGLMARMDGSAHRLADDQVCVRAWPVHEPGWKREVVHTVASFE